MPASREKSTPNESDSLLSADSERKHSPCKWVIRLVVVILLLVMLGCGLFFLLKFMSNEDLENDPIAPEFICDISLNNETLALPSDVGGLTNAQGTISKSFLYQCLTFGPVILGAKPETSPTLRLNVTKAQYIYSIMAGGVLRSIDKVAVANGSLELGYSYNILLDAPPAFPEDVLESVYIKGDIPYDPVDNPLAVPLKTNCSISLIEQSGKNITIISPEANVYSSLIQDEYYQRVMILEATASPQLEVGEAFFAPNCSGQLERVIETDFLRSGFAYDGEMVAAFAFTDLIATPGVNQTAMLPLAQLNLLQASIIPMGTGGCVAGDMMAGLLPLDTAVNATGAVVSGRACGSMLGVVTSLAISSDGQYRLYQYDVSLSLDDVPSTPPERDVRVQTHAIHRRGSQRHCIEGTSSLRVQSLKENSGAKTGMLTEIAASLSYCPTITPDCSFSFPNQIFTGNCSMTYSGPLLAQLQGSFALHVKSGAEVELKLQGIPEVRLRLGQFAVVVVKAGLYLVPRIEATGEIRLSFTGSLKVPNLDVSVAAKPSLAMPLLPPIPVPVSISVSAHVAQPQTSCSVDVVTTCSLELGLDLRLGLELNLVGVLKTQDYISGGLARTYVLGSNNCDCETPDETKDAAVVSVLASASVFKYEKSISATGEMPIRKSCSKFDTEMVCPLSPNCTLCNECPQSCCGGICLNSTKEEFCCGDDLICQSPESCCSPEEGSTSPPQCCSEDAECCVGAAKMNESEVMCCPLNSCCGGECCGKDETCCPSADGVENGEEDAVCCQSGQICFNHKCCTPGTANCGVVCPKPIVTVGSPLRCYNNDYPSASCQCYPTVEGINLLAHNVNCQNAIKHCSREDVDCPPGQMCFASSCCGFHSLCLSPATTGSCPIDAVVDPMTYPGYLRHTRQQTRNALGMGRNRTGQVVLPGTEKAISAVLYAGYEEARTIYPQWGSGSMPLMEACAWGDPNCLCFDALLVEVDLNGPAAIRCNMWNSALTHLPCARANSARGDKAMFVATSNAGIEPLCTQQRDRFHSSDDMVFSL